MTNQEIADKLAEVMGWNKWELKGYPSYWEDAEGKMQITCDEWDPTTDLNQAVQAAEKVGLWTLRQLEARWWAASCKSKPAQSTIGPADALARAVVKAAGGSHD